MTTTGQQSLKAKVFQLMSGILNDDEMAELISTEIGYVPDHFTEIMGEAAFNVLLAIKDTNDYRDNND